MTLTAATTRNGSLPASDRQVGADRHAGNLRNRQSRGRIAHDLDDGRPGHCHRDGGQIWELTNAALTPARKRAATILQKLQASPQAQVKTAKAASPERMTRRRS